MSKSKQTQKTSETRNPYDPARPAIDQSLGGIQTWMSDPRSSEAYDGTMSDMTAQGIDRLGGAGGANTSLDYLTNVVNGGYLNAENPHQAALDASIRASVAPSINSTFSSAGMAGSTAHQGSLMKGLTQGLAAPRYQQYQNERGFQQQAAGLLPGIDAQIAQQQIGAGQLSEGYDRAQWEDERMAKLRPYLETAPLLQGYGSMGGTSEGTSTTTSKPSTASQLGGAAMMGIGMMSGIPGIGMMGGPTAANALAPQGSLPWQQGYSPLQGWWTGN